MRWADMSNEPSLTDWIQAITAAATGLLAVGTFSLSRGMYHAPFKTFLRPVRFKSNSEFQPTIHLLNIGPGIAFNVSVKMLHYKSIEQDPLTNNKLWYDDSFIFAVGPQEIKQDVEGRYTFTDNCLLPHYPILIEWNTITGKTMKSYWKYGRTYSSEVFTRLNNYEVLLFKSKRIWTTLRSPILKLRLFHRKKIANRQIEELQSRQEFPIREDEL